MLRQACPCNSCATGKIGQIGQNRSGFPRLSGQTTLGATCLLHAPERILVVEHGLEDPCRDASRTGERHFHRRDNRINWLVCAAPTDCRHAKSKTVIEDPTSVSALTELLELAGRSMHSIGYSDGLYPAQWTALRYFSKASDGARTASALARFQGFANGPVSRTVRTLISKGLLRKAESQPAGRAEHLEITENARSLLEHDPARVIAETIATLPEDEKAALDHAL